MNIYTEVSPSQITAEMKYFLAAIYKLLPYKEYNYEHLNNYFNSVLQQLEGFNKISGSRPEILTIMSLLAYAQEEKDFKKYRKAILDACGMMERMIKESDAGVSD